ncbi:MAG: hypothetical protein HRT67_01930 [Flavobacteriaceae bacterium]|nr:hypothetical protein [Flavobacteriaceae bacterium]
MTSQERDIASYKETVDELQKILTEAFYQRMFKYTIFRLSSKFNIKFDVQNGLRGFKVEDFISETIASFLKSDGRKWYKDDFPDFRKQFISALDSIIHKIIKKELQKSNLTWQILDNDKYEEKDSEYEDLLKECEHILESLNASDEELLLFEPYIINGMKRSDLEQLFGISAKELTNIKKRLDRKIPIIQKHLKELRK